MNVTLEPHSSYHACQHPSHVQHPPFQAVNYPPQSPRRTSSGPTGTLQQRSRNLAGIQRNAHSTTEHPTTPRHYTSIQTNHRCNHPRHHKLSPLQQADEIHSRQMHVTTCCPRLVRIRTGLVLRPILHIMRTSAATSRTSSHHGDPRG
jgi:hypothetical protein